MEEIRGKLAVRDGRYVCPDCKQITHQVARRDTEAKNLLLWCRNCKAKFLVNIENGQCFVTSRMPTNSPR